MPNSPNSIVSSAETSETQSISGDEPISIITPNNIGGSVNNLSSNRPSSSASNKSLIKKSTSKSSGGSIAGASSGGGNNIETERPPWRPVSIATPSKADRNALIKAKLLDATRRALISQRITHFGTQTDPIPTKIMHDFGQNSQNDLIQMVDENVETDGAVTIKRDALADGGFIMTQTIGQMTENILNNDIGTQTAQPKINLSFSRYVAAPALIKTSKRNNGDNNQKEINFQEQLNELTGMGDENNGKMNKLHTHRDSQRSSHSNSSNETSHGHNNQVKKETSYLKICPKNNITKKCERNYLPTTSYWEDLGSSSSSSSSSLSSGDKNKQKKQKYLSIPPTMYNYNQKTRLSNSRDDEIRNRLNNMNLSPNFYSRREPAPFTSMPNHQNNNQIRNRNNFPAFSNNKNNYHGGKQRPENLIQNYYTNEHRQAVRELIHEAHALINLFDYISLLLGGPPKFSINSNIKVDNSPLPPLKWDKDLTASCQQLEELLRQFKPYNY